MLNALEMHNASFSIIPVEMERFSSELETPIEYGPAAYASDLIIASIPISTRVDKDPSVMDMFLTMSPGARVLVVLALLLFWGLFRKFNKLRGVSFKLYACAMGQEFNLVDKTDTRCPSTSAFAMLYVIGVFWFMIYLKSFISTDMTVAVPEKVIDTLSDIYNAHSTCVPKMYPVILEGLNVESILFDSKQARSQKILKIIQTERAQCAYPKEEKSMMEIMNRVYDKTAAFLADESFYSGTKFLACLISATEYAHKYRRSKEPIHSMSAYHVYAKRLDDDLKMTLNTMNYRLSESGLQQDQHDQRATLTTPFFHEAPARAHSCWFTFDERKEIDAEVVKPFGLVYIAFAFYLYCAGVCIGSNSFFIELSLRRAMEIVRITRKGKKPIRQMVVLRENLALK